MRNMGNHGTRTLLALGMAAAVSAVQARGDDVWRGSTNAYSTVAWTDGAYWSQGTAPTNGGMARISAQKTSEINIDATSVSLDGLVLNGIATRFTGNAVTLSAGAPVSAPYGFYHFDNPLTLLGSARFDVTGGSNQTQAWNFVQLGGALSVAPGSVLTKTGSGELQLRAPTTADVVVEAGTLALGGTRRQSDAEAAGTISLHAGTRLALDGSGALGGMSVDAAAGATLLCKPENLLQFGEDGFAVGGASDVFLGDTARALADAYWKNSGITLKGKRRVTGPWTAEFTVTYEKSDTWDKAGAYAHTGLMFQNFQENTYSSWNSIFGPETANNPNVLISFTTYAGGASGKYFCWTNRVELASGTLPSAFTRVFTEEPYKNLYGWWAAGRTLKFHIEHDGAGGIDLRIDDLDFPELGPVEVHFENCDIAGTLGSDTAWVSIVSAGSATEPMKLTISSYSFVEGRDAGRKVTRYGGTVSATPDAPLAAEAAGSPGEPVAAIGGLTYADGASLTIDAAADSALDYPALGFEAYDGSGTLVKRGSGALALFSAATTAPDAVRLEEGALVLRDDACTVAPVSFTADDWYLRGTKNPGCFLNDNRLRLTPVDYDGTAGIVNFATLRTKRVLTQDWTLSATFRLSGNVNGWGQSLGFVFHNAPGGIETMDSAPSSIGLNVPNSVVLLNRFMNDWGRGSGRVLQVRTANNGGDPISTVDYRDVIATPYNRDVGMLLHHDAAAQTLTCIMTDIDAAVAFTNVFENVDFKANLGSDEGYIALGGGIGWFRCNIDLYDFRWSLDHPEEVAPGSVRYLESATVTAPAAAVVLHGSASGAVYGIGDVTLADGAGLRVLSREAPGTLAFDRFALEGTAAAEVDAESTLRLPAATVGTLSGVLAKSGAGTLALSGEPGLEETRVETGVLHLANQARVRGRVILTPEARVETDPGGLAYFENLRMGDAVLGAGSYTAETASWISGTGTIRVIRPTLTLILR